MAILGYARVSTSDQSLEMQLDALGQAGADRIFADEGVSGAVARRPALDELMAYARAGDVLVVWRLDRLGRSTRNVLGLIDDLAAREIGFRSLTEGLDSTGPMGRMLLTIIAAFAELERDVIRERTLAGLDAARARGRVGGRPRALSEAQLAFARQLRDQRMPVVQIAEELGVGRATVYRALG